MAARPVTRRGRCRGGPWRRWLRSRSRPQQREVATRRSLSAAATYGDRGNPRCIGAGRSLCGQSGAAADWGAREARWGAGPSRDGTGADAVRRQLGTGTDGARQWLDARSSSESLLDLHLVPSRSWPPLFSVIPGILTFDHLHIRNT